MNLIIFEIKKILKSASFTKIVLFFFILANFTLLIQLSDFDTSKTMYLNYHQECFGLNDEQLNDWIHKNEDALNQSSIQAKAYQQITKEIKAVINYDDYRNNMNQKYDNRNDIAIFNDGNSINDQYMQKVKVKYEQLELTHALTLQPYYGLEMIFNNHMFDLLLILFLLYLVYVIFIQEIKNNHLLFATTTQMSKSLFIVIKVVTMFLMICLFVSLCAFSFIVINRLFFGSIDLNSAIQSIDGFHGVCYDYSIFEYYLLFYVSKIIALLFLEMISVFLALKLKSEWKTFCFIVVFCLIQIYFYNQPLHQLENWFRFINIFTVFDCTMIKSYYLVQVQSILLDSSYCYIVVIVLSLILLLICFKVKLIPMKQKKQQLLKKKTPKVHSLLYYEMKKLWFHHGGLILLISFLILLSLSLSSYQDHFTQDEHYYFQYIDYIGDRVADDSDELIQKEEARIQSLYQKLENSSNDLERISIQNDLECEGGFQLYKNKIQALKKDPAKERLLKERQYDLLFTKQNVSKLYVILLYLSMAMLIPSYIFKDIESKVYMIQNTSVSKNKQLERAQSLAIFSYFLCFVVISAISILIRVNQLHDLKYMSNIRGLDIYGDFIFDMPIIIFYFLGVVMQLSICYLVSKIITYSTKYFKNKYVLMVILLAVSIFPIYMMDFVISIGLQIPFDLLFVFTTNPFVYLLICFVCLKIFKYSR